jgi:mono/diheme cytochrome c family protein
VKGFAWTGSNFTRHFLTTTYTLLSDEDVHALYAYVMTRQPIRATAPANDLTFPLNFRPAIVLWKALFFRSGRYRPDQAKDPEWNRGAYLADGLAHCGACHTPRNVLGAERKSEAFNGAPVEGWYAYAINRNSPAPVPWTRDALEFYLAHGWQEQHGMARGPMAPVVMDLSTAPRSDVNAIAAYIASFSDRAENSVAANDKAKRSNSKLASADSLATAPQTAPLKANDGAAIYTGACAVCHESGRPVPLAGVNLSLSTAVNGPTPTNIINVTLYGLSQQPGMPSPIMPGFHGTLTDPQMVALLRYIRSAFSTKPPWPSLEEDVAKARRQPPKSWPSPALRAVMANNNQEVRPW